MYIYSFNFIRKNFLFPNINKNGARKRTPVLSFYNYSIPAFLSHKSAKMLLSFGRHIIYTLIIWFLL